MAELFTGICTRTRYEFMHTHKIESYSRIIKRFVCLGSFKNFVTKKSCHFSGKLKERPLEH